MSEHSFTSAMRAAAEAFLAEAFWGHREDEYRAPLPVVGVHTERPRGTGTIRRKGRPRRLKQVMLPPYIVACPAERYYLPDYDPEPIPNAVSIMLCDGDDTRATTDGEGYRGGGEPWIYADGDNVPEEWGEPIAKALDEIRTIWPGRRLLFRDTEDKPVGEAA